MGRARKAEKKVPDEHHEVALLPTSDIDTASNAVTESSSPSQSASGGSAVSLIASKVATDAPVVGMPSGASCTTSVPQYPHASSSVEGTQTVEVAGSKPPRISVPLVSESILDPTLHHATGIRSIATGFSRNVSHVLPQSVLSSGLRSVASRKQYSTQSSSLDESLLCMTEGGNTSGTYTRHEVGHSLSTLRAGSDISNEQSSLPVSSEARILKYQLSSGSAVVSSSDVNSALGKLDKMNIGVTSVSAVENLRTLRGIRANVPRPKSTPTLECLATPSSSRSAFMLLRSSLKPRTLRMNMRSKLETDLDYGQKLGEAQKRLHEQEGIQNEEEKVKTKKDLKNDENIQRQKVMSVRESSQEKQVEVSSSGESAAVEIESGPQGIRKGIGFTCPVCQMMFSNVTKLSQHVESHSSTSESSLVTSGIVSAHPGGSNGKKKGSHICHICSKAFVSVGKLIQHIEFHSSSSTTKLQELEMSPVITGIRGGGGKRRSGHTCRVCSKVFVSPGRLSNHMYAAHPGLSGSSSSVGELSAPGVSAVASVSGMKKKGNHVCPICSKVFGSPGKLSQHMYSHTGERPFVCSECNKAFSSKFKLVRHALIHSSDSERRYRCNACDRSFHRKDHLQNHAKVNSDFIYDCMMI